MAAPLTKLTSTLCPVGWTEEAEAAFLRLLYCHFHTYSVTPRSVQAFRGEGGCVGHRSGQSFLSEALGMRSCTKAPFSSHRLTPAERNYDVGNCGLLGMVLALQEWRHWLEGTAEPFFVGKDHKKLS